METVPAKNCCSKIGKIHKIIISREFFHGILFWMTNVFFWSLSWETLQLEQDGGEDFCFLVCCLSVKLWNHFNFGKFYHSGHNDMFDFAPRQGPFRYPDLEIVDPKKTATRKYNLGVRMCCLALPLLCGPPLLKANLLELQKLQVGKKHCSISICCSGLPPR